MPDLYRNRTVLLTGASAGIGAAMAHELGRRGARVVLVARREEALAQVADEVRALGGHATVMAADLSGADGAATLLGRLDGPIDVLINNAGYGVQGPFLSGAPGDAVGQIELNVTALTALTRALLPGMAERHRGGVLNVASIAGFVPAPRFAVYAATKAYVLSFTEALHHEMRGAGVAVTCLCPGPVRTLFAERAGLRDTFFDGARSAETVARAGLDGLAANRRTVVPGVRSVAQTVATRFLPKRLVLRVTDSIMERAG